MYFNATACTQLANKLQLNNYLKLGKQKRKEEKGHIAAPHLPLKALLSGGDSHNMFGKILLDLVELTMI